MALSHLTDKCRMCICCGPGRCLGPKPIIEDHVLIFTCIVHSVCLALLYRAQKIISLILLVCIVVCTLLVIAMCGWGISGSMSKVGKIIPDTFDSVGLIKNEVGCNALKSRLLVVSVY